MNVNQTLLMTAAMVVSGFLASRSSAQAPAAAGPDRYIVQVNVGENAAGVARAHGLAPTHVYTVAVNGFAAAVPAGRLQALQNDPRVAHVVPDRPVFAFVKPGGGGGSTAQVVPAGVDRIDAEPGKLTYTGTGVGVAIVDTGLDLRHADLIPVGAASYVVPNVGTSAQDDNGHGTHVGGIVAARNNEIDVVGVAPDATLYAVKVLKADGTGFDSDVISGLDWIAANANAVSPPVRVVNMSLGREGTLDDNPALRTAVQTLFNNNITVVVSAGNRNDREVSQIVPATYPEVMAVASTTAQDGSNNRCKFFSGSITADTASYFTTDGQFDTASGIGVSISAPGEDKENISRSCFIQPVGILSTKLGGGTTRMFGTSMSAPHVTGVVALLWEKLGFIPPEDARARIRGVNLLTGENRADRVGVAPIDSPASGYTYDGEREGVLWAPGALSD